jgi:hypothetical protein
MKRFLFALIFVLMSGPGFAACPSLPFNLTNGTTADASQVMGDLNSLLNCFNSSATNVPRSYLSGLTISNDGTSPTTTIDVAVGVAASDDAMTMMPLTAVMIKNAGAAWAAGSSNGCLDAGSSLSATTWYHVFLIERTDTGAVDVLCSQSATLPMLPTNYSKQRRIGSILTNGTAQILAFTQSGDEFLWKAPVQEWNIVPTSTTPATKALLGVPTGVEVWARMTIESVWVSGGVGTFVYALDTGTQSAASGLAQTYDIAASSGQFAEITVRTNAVAQVGWVSTAAGANFYGYSLGWIDRRGRDN